MKQTFRHSMRWLHTWSGLLLGGLLYFIFLTGTLGYFNAEIDHWMRPEQVLAANHAPPEEALSLALKRLSSVASNAESWSIDLPHTGRGDSGMRISYRLPAPEGEKPKTVNERLDADTGLPLTIEERKTSGGWFLYRMHYRLHYLSGNTPLWMVGGAGMFMLTGLVTGIIIHRRFFQDLFTFRPGLKARSWLDVHILSSVIALPFHFMITYSGLLWFMFTYMSYIVPGTYGEAEEDRKSFFEAAFPRGKGVEPAGTPAPLIPVLPLFQDVEATWGAGNIRYVRVEHLGDANGRIIFGRRAGRRLTGTDEMIFASASGKAVPNSQFPPPVSTHIRNVLLSLHQGNFAGPLLRWLYFLLGLLSTAMIASGLILWTVKRRSQHESVTQRASFGYFLVERLNIGTIVGLPIGIAVYFLANRLLPVSLSTRSDWEAHSLFIAWGLMLIHPFFRPVLSAWQEQLTLASILYCAIPVIDLATAGAYFHLAWQRLDWPYLSFNFAVLLAGLSFFYASRKTGRRKRPALRDSVAAAQVSVRVLAPAK